MITRISSMRKVEKPRDAKTIMARLDQHPFDLFFTVSISSDKDINSIGLATLKSAISDEVGNELIKQNICKSYDENNPEIKKFNKIIGAL